MAAAKEMFEELGFHQKMLKSAMQNGLVILYARGSEKIEFRKKIKCCKAWKCENYLTYPFAITLELHKAIHQQMKELGWLDE